MVELARIVRSLSPDPEAVSAADEVIWGYESRGGPEGGSAILPGTGFELDWIARVVEEAEKRILTPTAAAVRRQSHARDALPSGCAPRGQRGTAHAAASCARCRSPGST